MNLLTTLQRYFPIARAEQRAEAARMAYIAAGEAYRSNPNLENSRALTLASDAFRKAREQYEADRLAWKHLERAK